MTSNWIRWSALAAMLGGVAYVGDALVFLTTPGAQGEFLQDALLLAAYLLTATGLTGFHVLQKESYGLTGRAGFYTAIAGSLAMIFVMALVLAGGAEIEWLHGIGALIMVIGYVLYGVAILQAKMLPRGSGVAFILVGPMGIIVPGEYTPVVLGVAWVALGYKLWTRSGAMVRQPTRMG